MKKFLCALAISSLTISLASTAQAQTTDPKLEWANKVVALQQGPELDRLVGQLADSAAQDILRIWVPTLQSSVPKAKQDQAKESLNRELKKYFDDVSKTINGKVGKVSTDSLVPAYMERFSLDELKQLVAFFESSTVKKYQAAAPELSGVFIKQLIEATREDVTARTRQFDGAAAKIVGSAPAATSPAPDKSQTPAKK